VKKYCSVCLWMDLESAEALGMIFNYMGMENVRFLRKPPSASWGWRCGGWIWH